MGLSPASEDHEKSDPSMFNQNAFAPKGVNGGDPFSPGHQAEILSTKWANSAICILSCI
jgi:hypothetical protein